ncbi:MAG: hypothetical protein R2880_20870 [Deinococcales bacterium]
MKKSFSLIMVLALMGSILGTFAQQATMFQGSLAHQPGMTLESIQPLVKVTEAEAIARAQQLLGTAESPTEVALEVYEGYVVWKVHFSNQEVYVDVANLDISSIDHSSNSSSSSQDDDNDYNDDDDSYDDSDDDSDYDDDSDDDDNHTAVTKLLL